ncbi:hypothetical protein C9374_009295 [Naegleria lovaniensis]|uniref:Uncharacterized protein n=1 Tax=Naegleria lovaniensis TaxID=51637 RepID=A0AA88KK19_NAELO|nr:uncharacterized protein C9374_009295 [Naegleria lovaniensis]KAG2377384.1 hypothetical protein C9374_009295 [Naegleria lovaniensis]
MFDDSPPSGCTPEEIEQWYDAVRQSRCFWTYELVPPPTSTPTTTNQPFTTTATTTTTTTENTRTGLKCGECLMKEQIEKLASHECKVCGNNKYLCSYHAEVHTLKTGHQTSVME